MTSDTETRKKGLFAPRETDPNFWSVETAKDNFEAFAPFERTKLAQRIASRIEHKVIELGWPVGLLLGSEGELQSRFGASRAAMREAFRILEQQGVAIMRRGARGGLVVAAPAPVAVIQTLVSYLEFADVDPSDVLEARRILEALSIDLATERLSTVHASRLAGLLQQLDAALGDDLATANLHVALRKAVAEAAENEVLRLFLNVLFESSLRDFAQYPTAAPEALRPLTHSKRLIAEAILDRDAGRAKAQLDADLDFLGNLWRELNGSDDTSPAWKTADRRSRLLAQRGSAKTTGAKLAETLARTMLIEIRERGWPVGYLLGAEAPLIQEYGVSRAVFREAVRILERFNVVTMKPGLHGGLVVSEPSSRGTIQSAVGFLVSMDLDPRDLLEVRARLEIEAARLAAEHLDANSEEPLKAAFARFNATADENFSEAAVSLRMVIARLSGNPAISFLLQILLSLTVGPILQATRNPAALRTDLGQANKRIVDAIIARDADGAARGMRDYADLFFAV